MPPLMPITFSISPEYLRAAGTALLAGRDFTWHDDKNAPRVAVINREFARKDLWLRNQCDGPVLQDAGR